MKNLKYREKNWLAKTVPVSTSGQVLAVFAASWASHFCSAPDSGSCAALQLYLCALLCCQTCSPLHLSLLKSIVGIFRNPFLNPSQLSSQFPSNSRPFHRLFFSPVSRSEWYVRQGQKGLMGWRCNAFSVSLLCARMRSDKCSPAVLAIQWPCIVGCFSTSQEQKWKVKKIT